MNFRSVLDGLRKKKSLLFYGGGQNSVKKTPKVKHHKFFAPHHVEHNVISFFKKVQFR